MELENHALTSDKSRWPRLYYNCSKTASDDNSRNMRFVVRVYDQKLTAELQVLWTCTESTDNSCTATVDYIKLIEELGSGSERITGRILVLSHHEPRGIESSKLLASHWAITALGPDLTRKAFELAYECAIEPLHYDKTLKPPGMENCPYSPYYRKIQRSLLEDCWGPPKTYKNLATLPNELLCRIVEELLLEAIFASWIEPEAYGSYHEIELHKVSRFYKELVKGTFWRLVSRENIRKDLPACKAPRVYKMITCDPRTERQIALEGGYRSEIAVSSPWAFSVEGGARCLCCGDLVEVKGIPEIVKSFYEQEALGIEIV